MSFVPICGAFLVPGDGWTEAVLPFVLTSPTASGTPDYFRDPNAPGGVMEPAIAKARQSMTTRASASVKSTRRRIGSLASSSAVASSFTRKRLYLPAGSRPSAMGSP